jgi:hypothetical protein
MTSGYELLLDLARREAEVVASGRLDEMRALQEEREQLRATLPAIPPAEAKHLLEEAFALTRSTEAVLLAALAETGAELRRLSEGRRAVQAYTRGSM